MKKQLFIIMLLAFTFMANAQIKIHPSNGISIGGTVLADPGTGNIQLHDSWNVASTSADLKFFTANGYLKLTATSGANLKLDSDRPTIEFLKPIKLLNKISIENWELEAKTDGSFKIGKNSSLLIKEGYYGVTEIDNYSYANYISFLDPFIKVNATYYYSDERLKEDIQSIESVDALNKISSLNGVSYKMKSEEFKVRKFGLIAQDVRNVIPEIVDGSEEEMLSIDYVAIIPILIEAIKEQQVHIDELEKRIGELGIK